MKQIIRKAQTLLAINYAYMVEYRAELILWVLSGSLPIILMGVWIQAAQSGRFGLTSTQFARYFLTVFIVRQFTVIWVVYEFEREVVEGKLSPRLLQPLDPVWHHVASHLAERAARMPFTLLLIAFFFILYPQSFWIPSLGNCLLFAFSIILAFSLRFIIQYTFALCAFWTERASAIENVFFLFYLYLSGLIAPLAVFPEPVRAVVMWTPFPYLVNFPVSLLMGLPVNIGQGFLIIFGWGLLFYLLNRWLWRQGLKRYSGMGA